MILTYYSRLRPHGRSGLKLGQYRAGELIYKVSAHTGGVD